jgi:hypothetical protein
MIEGRRTLTKKSKDSYWNLYFRFKKETPHLHEISKQELLKEVEEIKNGNRYIDSQQVIQRVLTKLGGKHNFHRQFDEKFSSIKKNQVLGMQLYVIMLEDNWDWHYSELQHNGHAHPHAAYFSPKIIP